MIALILNEIFSVLKPTTKRLQGCGLGLADAMSDIKSLHTNLMKLKADSRTLLLNAKEFIQKLNSILLSDELVVAVNMGGDLLRVEQGEEDNDETFITDVINPLIDALLSEIDNRFFKANEDVSLLNELRFLDLNILRSTKNNNESQNISLSNLCYINNIQNEPNVVQELINFESEFTKKNSQSESDCTNIYSALLDTDEDDLDERIFNTYDRENSDDGHEDSDENDENIFINDRDDSDDVEDEFDKTLASNEKKNCSCIDCILKYFREYEDAKSKFQNLYKIYKYAAVLPITEVKCERDFSKLKLTKNARRSSLKEPNLENLMIISAEADILNKIDIEDIVNAIAHSSSKLAKYLL